MLILETIIHWAGVVDELEFAKSLLNWCKHGFPELDDTVGRGVRGVLAKVILACTADICKNRTSDQVINTCKAHSVMKNVSNFQEGVECLPRNHHKFVCHSQLITEKVSRNSENYLNFFCNKA